MTSPTSGGLERGPRAVLLHRTAEAQPTVAAASFVSAFSGPDGCGLHNRALPPLLPPDRRARGAISAATGGPAHDPREQNALRAQDRDRAVQSAREARRIGILGDRGQLAALGVVAHVLGGVKLTRLQRRSDAWAGRSTTRGPPESANKMPRRVTRAGGAERTSVRSPSNVASTILTGKSLSAIARPRTRRRTTTIMAKGSTSSSIKPGHPSTRSQLAECALLPTRAAAPETWRKRSPACRILCAHSGHGLGTVCPSRTGSNELFGASQGLFCPKIGDPAKLTR